VPEPTIVTCDNCGKRNRVPAVATGTPRCAHCKAPLPWFAEADDQSYKAVVELAQVPVLVDMWAPWCRPCRTVSPALEQIAKEMAGELKLVKINVDEAPALAERFVVRHVPTLMVLRDGQVLASQPGAAPVNVLREWVRKAIDGDRS
jgi:thioredoxin 2